MLAVVLESDLGRRRVGWFRVWRPVVTVAVVVPLFLSSIPGGAANLTLQASGVIVGAVLGCLVASRWLVSMGWDPAFTSRHIPWMRRPRPAVVSDAGVGYASAWIAACVLRLAFAYGADHVFTDALGHVMRDHDLSGAALGNAFAFLAIAMSVCRSLVFAGRARAIRRTHESASIAPEDRTDAGDPVDRRHHLTQ